VGFLKAFLLPLDAWRLIRRDPALRKLTMLSAGVSAACFTALFLGLWYASPHLLGLLWERPNDWTVIVWIFATAAIFLVSFVVGAQTLPIILLAPLSERISIQTELALGAKSDEGGLIRFVVETGRSLQKAVLRVCVLLSGHALLLALWLIPGPGHAAWTIASVGWSALWLAFEYVDLTANRHGRSFTQVARFMQAHVPDTLGLGLAIYALLWVPLINVFFVPVAVVSATLLYRSKSESELIDTNRG
jgi:CysZ protein